MDGASIKQIGIASVLRSLFKGTFRHSIYKDLSNIVHSPDKTPHGSNIYSDFTLTYNQSIDDKLYNYNKLLNDSEKIPDKWFDETTINNYKYNPISKPYVSAHRFTITPSPKYKRSRSRSPPKYKRSRSRSRSTPKKKRKRSRSSSSKRKY